MKNETSQEVTIYTTPSCGYCKKAKSFLDDHGVDFTEHDVSNDREKGQEMVQKSGQMGVPVIIVGDDVIVGFDKLRLKETLEL